jgi:hypothetical protein
MRAFKLNEEYLVVCENQGTRYGFRHIAVLLHNGNEIDRHKVSYYNRTWERYEFETVMKGLISRHFENDIKEYKRSIKQSENNEHKEYYRAELDKTEKKYKEITEIVNKI